MIIIIIIYVYALINTFEYVKMRGRNMHMEIHIVH